MDSAHTVAPLETQVAGHGLENDGQRYFAKFPAGYKEFQHLFRGLLVHEFGFVLKPVQAPPRGTREVGFYQVWFFF